MIQAVTDKIVVESMRVGMSKQGLIIPNMGNDTQGYGKVLSVGEEVPECFKVGQILMFHPRAGMDTVMDESLMKIIKYEEAWGIVIDTSILNTLTPIVIGRKAEAANKGGGVVIAP
jgi:co-chaperonin GroES (HSP10)